ncbi:MAG: flagellar motor switch protein FliN [Sulfuricella sp.]|nr:flagellar motor switch protein FliN [Sulfuricella sp.]
MADETPDGVDDWAAAMAEQTSADAPDASAPGASSAGDDWGAALAEQTSTESQNAASIFGGSTPSAAKAQFDQFSPSGVAAGAPNNIDMILDIPVNLTVELGRTKLAIRSLLQLAQGSVVELDGLAGEPMDVLVNGCLIAQGEVVVVNDKFGIRLTDIISPSERIRRLHK